MPRTNNKLLKNYQAIVRTHTIKQLIITLEYNNKSIGNETNLCFKALQYLYDS